MKRMARYLEYRRKKLVPTATQDEVSELLGVSRSKYRNFEIGVTELKISDLERITLKEDK